MTTLRVTGAALLAILHAVRRASSGWPLAQERNRSADELGATMTRNLVIGLIAILTLAGIAGLELYSHMLAGIGSGGPVPLQSVAPKRLPTPKAITPRKGVAPAPAVTLSPARSTVSDTAKPVPDETPKIISVSLSSPVVTGGEVVTGTVQTTPGVTTVQASIAGYSSALQKVSSGYFALSYRVPNLPFFLHRTYTIQVTAQDARGKTASSSLPITIR